MSDRVFEFVADKRQMLIQTGRLEATAPRHHLAQMRDDWDFEEKDGRPFAVFFFEINVEGYEYRLRIEWDVDEGKAAFGVLTPMDGIREHAEEIDGASVILTRLEVEAIARELDVERILADELGSASDSRLPPVK